jgi:hypothetical protein
MRHCLAAYAVGIKKNRTLICAGNLILQNKISVPEHADYCCYQNYSRTALVGANSDDTDE